MTNYSVTISNSLNTFGPAPTDLWNAYNWNAFKWGEGTSDLQVFINLIVNTSSLTPTSDMMFRFMHMLDIGSTALASSVDIYFSTGVSISNTLTTDADMFAESLTDGSGYNYVFASNTTDGEQRTFPDYTEVDPSTSTWSTFTTSTTNWS